MGNGEQIDEINKWSEDKLDLYKLSKKQIERMDRFWGSTDWRNDIYQEVTDLLGTHIEKIKQTGKDLGLLFQKRLEQFFQHVTFPIVMKNSKEAPLNPAVWNEGRRTRIRAELDAYYARLYGLTEEELRYILGPQDVYGQDFPGETFRVLKEKEISRTSTLSTKPYVVAFAAIEG